MTEPRPTDGIFSGVDETDYPWHAGRVSQFPTMRLFAEALDDKYEILDAQMDEDADNISFGREWLRVCICALYPEFTGHHFETYTSPGPGRFECWVYGL